MAQTLVYISCANSREIQVFAFDPASGDLSLRQRLATVGAPLPLGGSADKRLLVAGMTDDDSFQSFSVDSASGALSMLGSAPGFGEPTYVSTDRRRRFGFCASYAGNSLSVFPLASNGAPGPAIQIETPLKRAHACRTDATNRWLLVPLLGEDAIRVYRLGDDGRLTPSESAMVRVRAGAGPRHIVISPDNRRVYCLNELDCTIDRFDFDAELGRLTLKESTDTLPPGFAGKPWGAELRATPDGRFLYASERTGSRITAFAVDSTSGSLRLIDHYPTERQPRGMDIDPSGKWLLAAGQLSNHLTVYACDPATGRLKAHQRHASGENPVCVEMLALP